MDDEIVAFACGRCGSVRAASVAPDACFGGCGAKFDVGAPVAFVRLEIQTTTCGALELSMRYRVETVGPWGDAALARVREVFGGG